jgi:uncharacterized protein (TIGR00297 family)
MILRALLGALAAAVIALTARFLKSLDTSGAVAAVIVGTASAAAGWRWAALLIFFFLSATALSRLRAAEKSRRTSDIISKGGERDAIQVLANGGIFAVAALLTLASSWHALPALALGALAAAASDTWATEVGTLVSAPPRMITTGLFVPPGTSGAVTIAGLGGSALGALAIAAAAYVARWPTRIAVAALIGGVVGSLADTLLGATLQHRRWCRSCESFTEQRTHRCGARTVHGDGIAWLNNDAVNFTSGLIGGVVALLIAL